MLLRMRASNWVALGRGALACALLAACGDDSTAVPFENIPKDKKLIELSADERQGVCQWGQGVAQQKLAPGGVAVTCHGNPISFQGCSVPSASDVNDSGVPRCSATVGQWEGCLPNFLDRIAQDPCQVLSLAFSPTDLQTFV